MEPKTYFREHEDDSVKGFTILESTDTSVQVAEKWQSPDRGARWTTYIVPLSKLNDRLSADLCERVGKLSDEQFEAVKERTGWHDEMEPRKAEA